MANRARYYVVDGHVECRIGDESTILHMPPDQIQAYAAEGLIWCHQRKLIALPDRSPPRGVMPAAGVTAIVKAIAAVKVRDIVASHESPDSIDMDAFHEAAIEWAMALTPVQKARLSRVASVRAERARLEGNAVSLDAVLSETGE